MRVIDLGDVNSGNGRSLPPSASGDWRAFALASDSLVHAVTIDGKLLSVGGVVPCESSSPNVQAVRGPRGFGDTEVVTSCKLVGYETGDLVPGQPSKRASVRVTDSRATAAAAYTRRLRLPFSGRRRAVFVMGGVLGQLFDWALVGITYPPLNTGGFVDNTLPPHTQDIGSGSFTPANNAFTGQLESEIIYVGGDDSFENFDEIELWYRNALAGSFRCIGEAFDE